MASSPLLVPKTTPVSKRLRPLEWKRWLKFFTYERRLGVGKGDAAWRWNMSELKDARKLYGDIMSMGGDELIYAMGSQVHELLLRDVRQVVSTWQASIQGSKIDVQWLTVSLSQGLQALTDHASSKVASIADVNIAGMSISKVANHIRGASSGGGSSNDLNGMVSTGSSSSMPRTTIKFNPSQVHQMMERILLAWSYRNPSSHYRAGMHEVLGTILFAMLESDSDPSPLSEEESGCPASVMLQVLDSAYIEHDAYAIFKRVMEYIQPFYSPIGDQPSDGKSPSDDHFCTSVCEFIQNALLTRFDPFLKEHLESILRLEPSVYLAPILRSLAASIFPPPIAVIAWDSILKDLSSKSPSSVDWYEPPFFVYVIVALMVQSSPTLTQAVGIPEVQQALCSGAVSTSLQSLLQLAMAMGIPEFISSIAPNIDVAKFDEGPLGIILQQMDDTLIVNKFQSNGGKMGQAEASGRVQCFDSVYAVNGVRRIRYSPQQFVELIKRVGRPVYVAFQHNEVFLGPSGDLNLPDGFIPDLLAGERMLSVVPAGTSHYYYLEGSKTLHLEMSKGHLILTNYRLHFHHTSRGILKYARTCSLSSLPSLPPPSPSTSPIPLASPTAPEAMRPSDGFDPFTVIPPTPTTVRTNSSTPRPDRSSPGQGSSPVMNDFALLDPISLSPIPTPPLVTEPLSPMGSMTSTSAVSSTRPPSTPTITMLPLPPPPPPLDYEWTGGRRSWVEGDWLLPIHTLLRCETSIKQQVGSGGSTGSMSGGDSIMTLVSKDGQVRKFVLGSRHLKKMQDFATQLTVLCQSELSLFAFDHFKAVVGQIGAGEAKRKGMFVYSIEEEYQRIGLHEMEGLQRINQWECQPAFCDTYPEIIYVPAGLSTLELFRVCSYRSGNRIPVVTWADRRARVTLSRSSQPLVGLQQNRCLEDEKLVTRLRMINNREKYFIIDARGKMSSHGNRFMGKGSELIKFYPGVDVLHMNIDNVHAVRQSEQALHQLCRPSHNIQSGFLEKVESTGWLQHIQSILSAAVHVMGLMSQGYSVLVHCSDGWDRTSQIVSLTELLVDPYYRTLVGFHTLIQKDWLDFGHQFATRCGHTSLNSNDDQRSPIFILFLDCVHQILRQFPSYFEFNESLLVALGDHAYSCRFGTFLKNNNRERQLDRIQENTLPVWNNVQEHLEVFRNKDFTPFMGQLHPSVTSKNLVLWSNYFQRKDYAAVPLVTHPTFF